MSIYEALGLTPVINASGTLTRLGGSRMAPEVLAAMTEAAATFVPIDELQERAGAVIAEITGAEAGYVTSGAAAGLTLAAVACIAGMNPAAMDQLPDTTGLRAEIVVQRGHRNAYDHALRASGARFVEVGYLGYPGAGGTWPWQIEAAITERTVAVACPILDTPGTVPLPIVCEIAHRHGLPVIVDAAAELPPRANLRRFIEEGADLVVFSGGKAIGGPQASGVLTGRRALIDSVALQHQDMDVRPETWSRREWIADGRIAGAPHQGAGRGMKVGREEIVGLVTALQRFAAGADEADFARWSALLDPIETALAGAPGVSVKRLGGAKKPVPLLAIDLEPNHPAGDAYAIVQRLLRGAPRVAIGESWAEFNRLVVNPQSITADEALIVADRLRAELGVPGR